MLVEPVNDDVDTTLVTPVRWGILGAGMIAGNAILPAFGTIANAAVVGVASRDRSRAQAFAAEFHIPRAYGGYDLLIDDPDIEAIYIALPNHLHAEWAIRAMAAGKHVLCEKPLAVTPDEALAMIAAAEEADVILMEAVMYRFHPRIRDAAELIQTGSIGQPVALRASFCFTMTDLDNYRNDPEYGGGALLDVGSYGVNAARYFLDEEPLRALAFGTLAESGVDSSVSGVLEFPSGALAQVQCSFASAPHQELDITGTLGVITIPQPFTAWRNDDAMLRLTQESVSDETLYPPVDHYALMLAHFSACVRGLEEPLLPADDGLGTLRVLAALRRSLTTGRAERVVE
jgi:predicted dehydrogenase